MPSVIKKRNIAGDKVQDLGAIENYVYSEHAGAKKVSEVGRALQPIENPAGTFTTNATSATPLPRAGRNLAVYNNSSSVGSITLGEDSTVASLAAGVTDSSGRVGIACAPNSWTYIAAAQNNWVIASASTLLVYIISDNTYIVTQPQTVAST